MGGTTKSTRKSADRKRKPTQDNSRRINVTFSVKKSAITELKKEAAAHNMTLNQKINFLLRRETAFQRHMMKNNGVMLPARPILSLLDASSDEGKALQFIEASVLEVASWRLAENYKSSPIKELAQLFQTDILWTGFYTDFKVKEKDHEVIFVFGHDFGMRWSRILGEGLSRCIKELTGKTSTYRIFPASVVLAPLMVEEVTEVLTGTQNAVRRGVMFMSNVKERMDLCYDGHAPSIVLDIPEYRDGYLRVRERGGKIRVITDINKDNLHYCKRLIELVDELRHMSGAKGGMAVSESEYMATIAPLEESIPLVHVLYCNVRMLVLHQQAIFDMLWDKAVPALERIHEIVEEE
jgi:hypothetical protein